MRFAGAQTQEPLYKMHHTLQPRRDRCRRNMRLRAGRKDEAFGFERLSAPYFQWSSNFVPATDLHQTAKERPCEVQETLDTDRATL